MSEIINIYLEHLCINEKKVLKFSADAIKKIKATKLKNAGKATATKRPTAATQSLLDKISGRAKKFSTVNKNAYMKISAQRARTANVRKSLGSAA